MKEDEVETLVQRVLKSSKSTLEVRGKNVYIENKESNLRLTINTSTCRLITVDRLEKKLLISIECDIESFFIIDSQ